MPLLCVSIYQDYFSSFQYQEVLLLQARHFRMRFLEPLKERDDLIPELKESVSVKDARILGEKNVVKPDFAAIWQDAHAKQTEND